MTGIRLRIGTRGSPLALAQATEARALLAAAHGLPLEAFEVVAISTSGDRILDRPLAEIGGKGLFTREIEDALLDGRIDIAVHSAKDMPTRLPDGLGISAFLRREDPRDAFIGGSARSIAALRPGAVVGSSSLRRGALVRRMRPDISVVMFRGNVQTRLRKLGDGMVDATILAVAGLRRLGLEQVATELMPVELFPPSPGQGAICIESRIGDGRIDIMLADIHHRTTGQALDCERAFLAVLDGSCRTPIAGYAVSDGSRLRFFGMVLSPDGSEFHEVKAEGLSADAVRIGEDAALVVNARAGPKFFRDWTAPPDQPAVGFSRQTVQLSAPAMVTQTR